MSIQRYEFTDVSKPYMPRYEMEPDESGDYVLYADHEAELATERERAEEATREIARHCGCEFDSDYGSLAHGKQTAECSVHAVLRAELAALRADAERYRWLRDKYTVLLLNGETELRITHGPRANSKSGIDDVIDAARGDTRRGRAPHWGSDDKG